MTTVFKATFLKSIEKIKDGRRKDEIARTIENVEEAKDLRSIINLKKLKGQKNFYRIKIRNIRVGLKITNDLVYFVDLEWRKDIYKHFP
ncbi:MAG: type II toxin-antitoxin system RelE/ParE family toxin [Bacteroidetes bacterium]|nr:type II toxin-antitoxin system RelE/ParE family toxin [Bacteroidota bacterium]